jgi:hypothetical protein
MPEKMLRHRSLLLLALLARQHSCSGFRTVPIRLAAQARYQVAFAQARYPHGPIAKAVLVPAPKVVPRHFITFQGHTLTLSGMLMGFSVFSTAFFVQIPVLIAHLWSQHFDEHHRCRGVDWVIHFWARASMTACGYIPEVVGLENLEGIGTALYIPNHTSFLDILTLTGASGSLLHCGVACFPCMPHACAGLSRCAELRAACDVL